MSSPVFNVHVGDHVEIMLSTNPRKRTSGTVAYIFPDSSNDEITVLLKNGDKGLVFNIINSEEMRKERIMGEDQHTENKENFFESNMSNLEIPQTVQSFLNSEGGYLYIGVRDTGTSRERLVGLDPDFEQISNHKLLTNDKLCDELERKIMNALDKYLESDTALGPLVEIKFVRVSGTQIVEIDVLPSPKPWFYRHLARSNKPKSFELWFSGEKEGERVLDDFYIRRGGSKKRLPTHKEFYTYVMDHFKT